MASKKAKKTKAKAKTTKAKDKAKSKSKGKGGSSKKGKKPDLHPIEAEILEATGEDPRGSKEKEQKYYDRLVDAVAELDDDGWNDLSEDVQRWFNAAAESINKSKSIASFDDEASEPDDEEDEEDDDLEEEDEDASDDEEDEEEEDDTEDEESEGEEIDLEDLEVGMEVTIYDSEEEVLAEGEVVKIVSKTIKVEDDDGEVVSVKKSEIDSIFDLAEPDDEEDEEDDDLEEEDEDASDEVVIDFDDLEVGMDVEISDEEGSVLASGTVTKVLKKSVKVDDSEDEEVVSVKASDIDTILHLDADEEDDDLDDEEEEEEEEAPKSKRGRKSGKTASVTSLITEAVCKKPNDSEKKIASSLKKAKVDFNESTLHITYGKVHKIIDLLKEHGHLS